MDFADASMANRATARMAKLVDAWDLKSPARKGVPVRFRLRAPSNIKGLRAKANANPCSFAVRNFDIGPQFVAVSHFVGVTFIPCRIRMYGVQKSRMKQHVRSISTAAWMGTHPGFVYSGACQKIIALRRRI